MRESLEELTLPLLCLMSVSQMMAKANSSLSTKQDKTVYFTIAFDRNSTLLRVSTVVFST